jgi:uncharacterized RDD family membrane protein YckC
VRTSDVPEPNPLHEVSTIETPEQITVDLPLAGVGSRSLAYLVDLGWQSLPIIAAAITAYVFLPSEAKPDRFVEPRTDGGSPIPLAAVAFVSAVIFFVNFGYFALFEVLWKGQSPGKRFLGLRVVRDGGYPIDGRAALVRNLLRVVDFLPALYLVGIVTLFASRKGKRVGDYAAGTFVVKERMPGEVMAPVWPGGTGALSAAERSVVAEFLVRRNDLTYQARARVGRALANRLAERLGQTPPVDAEHFLEDLERDGRA